MSRGAQHSTRQLTDQQLAQQNQLISQTNQQGTQDRSLLLPTIQSLLTSPGYTPAEQSAITQQSMGRRKYRLRRAPRTRRQSRRRHQ